MEFLFVLDIVCFHHLKSFNKVETQKYTSKEVHIMTEHKFEVVDDYIIKYDGDYFDLHKPSDIRSLVTVANYIITENKELKQQLESVTQLMGKVNWKGVMDTLNGLIK
jgi:hypothetical protein